MMLDKLRMEAFVFTLVAVFGAPKSVQGDTICNRSLAPHTRQIDPQQMSIKLIHLKRRNWENNGTDTFVDRDGHFSVHSFAMGESKLVREGSLDQAALRDLVSVMCEANFFALPQEYKAPFQTQVSWWGYELTLETDTGSKTVRYHSEDKGVPSQLKSFTERIMQLAK